MSKNTTFFHKKLISWYLENKRDLPWRGTSNPYFIWLSEIMLQQTRVVQGLPYYLKFVNTFPTVFDLADASEEKVLKLWQGLGYYSRARNLHLTARHIAYDLKGVFPESFEKLLKLKGVGDYTASAIASICYNQPTAVVDGNVYRVLSRVFGSETPINSSKGVKEFKILAQELIDAKQPGIYNQAIMEFGARFCVPQNPECGTCIFNTKCEALKNKKVSQLPVKIKTLKIKKRYFNYLVVLSNNNETIVNQRVEKGIWQKLYEFPLIETSKEANSNDIKNHKIFENFKKETPVNSLVLYNEEAVVHKLSHQHLYTRFWIAEVSKIKESGTPISMIDTFPVPVLLENFISEFFQSKN